jgi:hypothetical protein
LKSISTTSFRGIIVRRSIAIGSKHASARIMNVRCPFGGEGPSFR